jgi:hypothetical protein
MLRRRQCHPRCGAAQVLQESRFENAERSQKPMKRTALAAALVMLTAPAGVSANPSTGGRHGRLLGVPRAGRAPALQHPRALPRHRKPRQPRIDDHDPRPRHCTLRRSRPRGDGHLLRKHGNLRHRLLAGPRLTDRLPPRRTIPLRGLHRDRRRLRPRHGTQSQQPVRRPDHLTQFLHHSHLRPGERTHRGKTSPPKS